MDFLHFIWNSIICVYGFGSYKIYGEIYRTRLESIERGKFLREISKLILWKVKFAASVGHDLRREVKHFQAWVFSLRGKTYWKNLNLSLVCTKRRKKVCILRFMSILRFRRMSSLLRFFYTFSTNYLKQCTKIHRYTYT